MLALCHTTFPFGRPTHAPHAYRIPQTQLSRPKLALTLVLQPSLGSYTGQSFLMWNTHWAHLRCPESRFFSTYLEPGDLDLSLPSNALQFLLGGPRGFLRPTALLWVPSGCLSSSPYLQRLSPATLQRGVVLAACICNLILSVTQSSWP